MYSQLYSQWTLRSEKVRHLVQWYEIGTIDNRIGFVKVSISPECATPKLDQQCLIRSCLYNGSDGFLVLLKIILWYSPQVHL